MESKELCVTFRAEVLLCVIFTISVVLASFFVGRYDNSFEVCRWDCYRTKSNLFLNFLAIISALQIRYYITPDMIQKNFMSNRFENFRGTIARHLE